MFAVESLLFQHQGLKVAKKLQGWLTQLYEPEFCLIVAELCVLQRDLWSNEDLPNIGIFYVWCVKGKTMATMINISSIDIDIEQSVCLSVTIMMKPMLSSHR